MRRVAVIGASLAGHHAARTLRARGFDGAISVVGGERHRPYDRYPLSKGFLAGQTERRRLDLADDVPTSRTLGHLVARHLLGLHRAAGVHLRTRTRARGLEQQAGQVRGVVLDDGTVLPAGVVVMATGTRPNVDWLRDTGLDVAGGLDCRPTLHAVGSDQVVGAGDVVRVPHPLLGGAPLRVEHWASTREQAALAAENLLAGPADGRPLTALPEFGTTIHGARLRALGFPQAADSGRVVWGSLESGAAVVVLSRGGSAVAAISVNATAELSRWAPGLSL